MAGTMTNVHKCNLLLFAILFVLIFSALTNGTWGKGYSTNSDGETVSARFGLTVVTWVETGEKVNYDSGRRNEDLSFSQQFDFQHMHAAGQTVMYFLIATNFVAAGTLVLLGTTVFVSKFPFLEPLRPYATQYSFSGSLATLVMLCITAFAWSSLGYLGIAHVMANYYPSYEPQVVHSTAYWLVVVSLCVNLLTVLYSYVKVKPGFAPSLYSSVGQADAESIPDFVDTAPADEDGTV